MKLREVLYQAIAKALKEGWEQANEYGGFPDKDETLDKQEHAVMGALDEIINFNDIDFDEG